MYGCFYFIYLYEFCFRIHKAVKEIDKCLQKQDSGAWAHSNVLAVTRVLGELYRVLNERVM